MSTAVRFEELSVTYDERAEPAVPPVDLTIAAGEVCLLVGATGCGKSSLLRTVNGHVPHVAAAALGGRVETCGRDLPEHRPRDVADLVGIVPQRPRGAFVAGTAFDEVARAASRLDLSGARLRAGVEDLLERFDLGGLGARTIAALSDGQRQRLAVAAALAGDPEVLVLDEPTSALDPAGARLVLERIIDWARDTGGAAMLAEQRLERIGPGIATAALFTSGMILYGATPDILRSAPLAPPVAQLSRLLAWRPTALTVPEALHAAATNPLPEGGSADPAPAPRPERSDEVVVRAHQLSARPSGHKGGLVLDRIEFAAYAGEVVAVMGRSGAGKSTLLSCLAGRADGRSGSARVTAGRAEVVVGTESRDPADLTARDRGRTIGYVPADPGALFFTGRVDAECAAADDECGAPRGRTAFILESLLPGVPLDRPPHLLSGGEQTALALAIVLARNPAVVLLDEPTTGLDYPTKERLTAMLRELARDGQAVVVATHDVELVAQLADRVLMLGAGRVAADGPTDRVLLAAPEFVPQVAQVLHPAPLLTVDAVRRALALGTADEWFGEPVVGGSG